MLNKLKAIFKSKTIWFAIALSVLSVWQGLIGSFDLDPATQGMVGSVISICIVVLRFVTTMPLEDKTKE